MKVKDDFYDMMAMKWIDEDKQRKMTPIKHQEAQYPKESNQAEMQEQEQDWIRQNMISIMNGKPLPNAINPSHYKDIVPGYEYFDIMDYMLEGWEGPEAHALGNGLKYLMRLNKKDNNVQELGKAIWYLTRLKEYLERGGYREYRKATTKRNINK